MVLLERRGTAEDVKQWASARTTPVGSQPGLPALTIPQCEPKKHPSVPLT